MKANRQHIQQSAYESLIRLGKRLGPTGPPTAVIQEAIKQNPWFTPYFIRRAWKGVAGWFAESELYGLIKDNEAPDGPPARVGIIAAGNVPWVGLHDVVVTLLSGHQAHVKLARQDVILMEWFLAEWKKEWAGLAEFFHGTKLPEDVDYLIATGSNNSARYFAEAYQNTPFLIRKHRYSVAYLDNSMGESELAALNDDIFLNNGLGCRNVSNLIFSPGFPLKRLQESLETYTHSCLNSLYLERVLWASEINRVLGTSVIHTPYALLQPSFEPGNTSMGILRVVSLEKEDDFCDGRKNIRATGSVSWGKMLNLGKLNHQEYPILRITSIRCSFCGN